MTNDLEKFIKNAININNIDTPVYRIFSYERFIELITTNQLVLVQPVMTPTY